MIRFYKRFCGDFIVIWLKFTISLPFGMYHGLSFIGVAGWEMEPEHLLVTHQCLIVVIWMYDTLMKTLELRMILKSI